MTRSRENIRSSREGLNVEDPMTSSHTQQQMKMFQVHGDEGSSSGASTSKPKKIPIEDKFLKEITAKIANRHLQDQLDENGGRYGAGAGEGSSHQTDIDAHVELMRKQKKSNDNVHKALVNELRKHLSEGDEGVEIEKVPRGLKKPAAAKKVPDSTNVNDSNKRMKTETGKEFDDFGEGSSKDESAASVPQFESPRRAQVVPTVQTFTKIYPKTDVGISEGEGEEMEYSERSALLSESVISIQSVERQSYKNDTHTSVRDRSSDYEVSMQQSVEELPLPDFHTPTHQSSEEAALSEEELAESKEGGDMFLEHHETDSSIPRVQRSSAERTINTIGPAAIAATVTAAAPAAAELSPVKKTPSVAPKPKHKDRHSFPAAHTLYNDNENSGLSVEVVGRPKSEMVENLRQAQNGEDSTA